MFGRIYQLVMLSVFYFVGRYLVIDSILILISLSGFLFVYDFVLIDYMLLGIYLLTHINSTMAGFFCVCFATKCLPSAPNIA